MDVKPGESLRRTRTSWMCSYVRAFVGHKICWSERIINEEIRIRADIEPIRKQVARLRWTWLGQVLRMDN